MAEIKALIEGYKEFYKKYFASGDALYKDLVKGQSPKTLFIACSDSRVDPSIVTNANPGDIFVIRNVANLVPKFDKENNGLHGVSAALEFAVCVLGVKNIVVMGHSGCAGINTLLHPESLTGTDFISDWMSMAKPAKEKALGKKDKGDLNHICEKEGVLFSLDNLLTFPWIKSRIEDGELKLHGWHFELENGGLFQYEPNTDEFEKITV